MTYEKCCAQSNFHSTGCTKKKCRKICEPGGKLERACTIDHRHYYSQSPWDQPCFHWSHSVIANKQCNIFLHIQLYRQILIVNITYKIMIQEDLSFNVFRAFNTFVNLIPFSYIYFFIRKLYCIIEFKLININSFISNIIFSTFH